MRKVYTIHPMAMYIGCTVKNIDLGCQQHDSACMRTKIIIGNLPYFLIFMTTTTLPFSWMDEEGLYYTPNGYVHWLYSQKYRLGLSTAWQCLLVLQNHHFQNFDKKYFCWLQPHYLFHGWMRKVYTIHPMAMYIGCTVKNIDLGCQQHDSACMWPKIIIPKNSIIFNFYDYNHITFSMDGWGRSILYTQWLCTLVVQSKISTWVVNSMTVHACDQKSSLVICHNF